MNLTVLAWLLERKPTAFISGSFQLDATIAVIDAATGEPVENATVWIERLDVPSKSELTNKAGQARIQDCFAFDERIPPTLSDYAAGRREGQFATEIFVVHATGEGYEDATASLEHLLKSKLRPRKKMPLPKSVIQLQRIDKVGQSFKLEPDSSSTIFARDP